MSSDASTHIQHKNRTKAYLLVLLLGQVNEDLASWVLDIQKAQNCGAIVRYCDILENLSISQKNG